MVLPMTQGPEAPLERAARTRVRALRRARGLSLDQLAELTHMSPSTLSRLETGRRRMAIDHLVTLAKALGTTVDELVAEEREEDVVIRPRRDTSGGMTFWSLTDPGETSGRVVTKMRIPQYARLPETRVHPGRDWFYVLSGTLCLQLGDRQVLVRSGQAASFATMTPHSLGGNEGPVEILSIFDHHGERAHLQD
jgi:transcriptional regulator with XRE-family HTH domain